jgi:LDH2 family malate/lactate/ureidoglycolate dehydrogenase
MPRNIVDLTLQQRRPAGASGFGWSSLKRRVAAYLEGEGVPTDQADRFSQEIIALCADEADSIGADRIEQRVQNEAQTLLEGWQAARRASLLAAA